MKRNFLLETEIPDSKDPKSVVVKLSGTLTLPYMAELKKQIHPILKKNSKLHFEVKMPDEMDLAFIQLLVSTIRTAEEMNKTVSHSVVVTDELLNLLDHSGFLSVLNIVKP